MRAMQCLRGAQYRFSTELMSGDKLRMRNPNAQADEYIHLAVMDTGTGIG